ncbi:MAG: hypothetical protein M1598_05360 [Actinobacteria bacterium]|nr:hypothetical protein [Actinomycetota bacterium]
MMVMIGNVKVVVEKCDRPTPLDPERFQRLVELKEEIGREKLKYLYWDGVPGLR